MTNLKKINKTTVRIKEGVIFGQDFSFPTWPIKKEDVNLVFEIEEKLSNGRIRLVADGYGNKGNYGNGAVYVDEDALIFDEVNKKIDWAGYFCMEVIDIIFNREAGWSKKLEAKMEKMLLEYKTKELEAIFDELIGEEADAGTAKFARGMYPVLDASLSFFEGYNKKRKEIIKLKNKLL